MYLNVLIVGLVHNLFTDVDAKSNTTFKGEKFVLYSFSQCSLWWTTSLNNPQWRSDKISFSSLLCCAALCCAEHHVYEGTPGSLPSTRTIPVICNSRLLQSLWQRRSTLQSHKVSHRIHWQINPRGLPPSAEHLSRSHFLPHGRKSQRAGV